MKLKAIGWLSFWVLVPMGCDQAPPALTAATRPTTREWDFSESREISRIPWPKERMGPLDVYHHEQVEGQVRISFANGRVFERYVHLVTFRRSTGILGSVTLSLENQAVDPAFKTAMNLAELWDLPSEPLLSWYAKAKAGQHQRGTTIRNDLRPTVALEIFTTLDAANPYAISLQIGWPEEEQDMVN